MVTCVIENSVEKDQIEKLVHRWGGSISEVSLDDPSFRFFCDPGIEGFIGYRLENCTAVVFGDPVCSSDNTSSLAQAFHQFCQENQLEIIFMISSKSFAKWAVDHICKVLIEVGEEIAFDPQIDPTEGHSGYRLRNKLHHAAGLGLNVFEYTSFDKSLENKIQDLGQIWLKARSGPQIHLGNINFFEQRKDKRWFYVQDNDGQVIGAALLSKLETKGGWLLKFLITLPHSPRGSSELLMTTILQTLKKENCHYLTYGIVPAESLGEVKGIGPFTTWLMKKIFMLMKWLFRLEQRKTYWHKFRPSTEPSYVLFTKDKIGIKDVLTIMKALKVD